MKPIKMLGISSIFILLGGCVTVEPLSYYDGENQSAKVEPGSSFMVRSFAPLVGYEEREYTIRNKGDAAVAGRSDSKGASRLESNLIESITLSLREKGLTYDGVGPDYTVVFSVSEQFRSPDGFEKNNLVVLRILVFDTESEKEIFDRTGRFSLNDKFTGGTVKTASDFVLETFQLN